MNGRVCPVVYLDRQASRHAICFPIHKNTSDDKLTSMSNWPGVKIAARIYILCAFGLVATNVASASAARYQSLDAIRTSVKQFLVQHARGYPTPPRIQIGTIDPRLRLAPCETALAPFLPPGGRALGNVTVGVRCTGAKPWTLYVDASVKLYQDVVVLTRALPRGTLVTITDVRLEERDVGTLLSGFMTDPSEAVDMQMKRSLTAGSALNSSVVALPKLIRRGQRVTLLARGDGVEVRSQGKALSDGAEGERVSVKNLSSNRIVQGIVSADGLIMVPM